MYWFREQTCFKFTLAVLQFIFLQTSVAAAKTERGLCLAQYCIFIIVSCRSPELYPQNFSIVSYMFVITYFGNLGYDFFLVIPKL